MEKGGISIIPTLRPNSNLSYEFIAIYPNGQSNEFRYFNSLNSEDPLNFIGFLTFSILTEQSKQDIFPQGGITITDLDIDTEGAIPQNKNGTDCSLIVVTSETCISVSQNRVGSFCCKCTESTSSSLLCETVGGGGGYRPPTSGSTFGGGGGGNNNNNNNDFEGNFDLS